MGTSARPRRRHADGEIFQFRIELAGIQPPVWRRVAVSSRASLHELHGVVQHSLGREEADAYWFTIDGVRYHDPGEGDPGSHAASDAVALEVLELHPGAAIDHLAETYGEPWQHRLILEQAVPRRVGQRLPTCLAGGRAAPPDDCDGPTRYNALLDALMAPLDPRHAELREWLPEDFDPEWMDLTAINARLAKVPRHRPG
jgi:hypothetical protein